MKKPDPKDPAAPALPDASRLPRVPYQPVLTGQPALVTGANSGIGKAVALGLAHAGADVVVNYVVNPEAAEEVAHAIEGMGRKAITLKADVSKEDEVEQMFERCDRAFRNPAHLGQQCRAATGFAARPDDARAVEYRDRRQSDRPVSCAPAPPRGSSNDGA